MKSFAPKTTEPAPPIMTVQSLPAVMCEDEIRAYLRVPSDFLRTWLVASGDMVPSIPHFQMGQRTLFPTERVLAWLTEFHGYGGDMNHPSRKPKPKRRQPVARANEEGGAA